MLPITRPQAIYSYLECRPRLEKYLRLCGPQAPSQVLHTTTMATTISSTSTTTTIPYTTPIITPVVQKCTRMQF